MNTFIERGEGSSIIGYGKIIPILQCIRLVLLLLAQKNFYTRNKEKYNMIHLRLLNYNHRYMCGLETFSSWTFNQILLGNRLQNFL